MKKTFISFFLLFFLVQLSFAQTLMTPEILWSLARVSPEALSPDGKTSIFSVRNYDVSENKGESNLYSVAVTGGEPKQITSTNGSEYGVQFLSNDRIGYVLNGQWWEANTNGSGAAQISNIDGGISLAKVSPDGKYILFAKNVKLDKTTAEKYPLLPKTSGEIFDNLMYRHWDTWSDGNYSHIFYATYDNGKIGEPHDIMSGERFFCPQQPYGGPEDVTWSPDSKHIVYVCKKKFGKEYSLSTNTDIYFYNINAASTTNFTEENPGYDTYPVFSPDGKKIAWLSMARDGYEADKNRLMVYDFASGIRTDISKDWDETITSFIWNYDGKKIFFLEDKEATDQVFEITFHRNWTETGAKDYRQVTNGVFDVVSIVGQSGTSLVVARQDMNHATELFKVDIIKGTFIPLTQTNKKIYDNISMGNIEKRWIKTADGKQMLTWFIYPPNFDANKKYPTLLYCQGGPQSAVSQFYSFRWNFQLMAANGYIVVAPNRRGLPGFGTAWNEEISKDWGGWAIQDYLSAIDSAAKLPFVDKSRLGAVGASYGGYSVYMLEGVHSGRFKTFIAHCGLFNLESWYNTTEEMWFANWDIGGPYWGKNPPKGYDTFNPRKYADNWNTPIMVISNALDFRVPVNQGMEAFQLAQLKGIKSRFLYFPDEGHWVVKPQNSLLWHHEFFRWLSETL